MKIGVFSDVHSNLEALNACLARYEQEGVDHFIYCGDIIGYGPDPEECVKKISSLNLLACVLGNHDAVFVQPELEMLFNYDAKIALDENKKHLSEKSIRYLTALPTVARGEGFTAVHGTPNEPIKEYFSSCAQFRASYDKWQGKICFVGHSHLPFYIRGTQNSCVIYLCKREDATVHLSDKMRYVLNPGSVGKPRDLNPHASFSIWDTEKNTFRFIRQPYDFTLTQKKMQERKFPAFLINSVAHGL